MAGGHHDPDPDGDPYQERQDDRGVIFDEYGEEIIHISDTDDPPFFENAVHDQDLPPHVEEVVNPAVDEDVDQDPEAVNPAVDEDGDPAGDIPPDRDAEAVNPAVDEDGDPDADVHPYPDDDDPENPDDYDDAMDMEGNN